MPEEEPKKLLNWSNPVPAGKKVAYGGVVFDSKGNVLLREPKNHYDGYVWTFPKGRPDPGETPEQTALREVKEETGVDATIVGILPGDYVGGTTINRYFIMRGPDGSGFVAEDDPETAAVKWVSGDEATQYLEKTTNTTGRKRDLNVLTDAMKLVVRG
ncbi:NUDIX domain-containing protein [Dechloromonas sp. TW-R-39-2]|nr:NUDIX domain-containing protein [Dechloromonas sp. TW-R-39-2]